MIYIDNITVTPNPVETGKTVTVTLQLREEYPDTKQYIYCYPYRYGDPKMEEQ